MPNRSAGILLHRRRISSTEVFLIHPGGPFWKNKDAGAWSIPKGIVGPEEDALIAARREFKEETGFEVDGSSNFSARSVSLVANWSRPMRSKVIAMLPLW
jgi:predicted NUDIX family NTP pyrophosphohydrolase